MYIYTGRIQLTLRQSLWAPKKKKTNVFLLFFDTLFLIFFFFSDRTRGQKVMWVYVMQVHKRLDTTTKNFWCNYVTSLLFSFSRNYTGDTCREIEGGSWGPLPSQRSSRNVVPCTPYSPTVRGLEVSGMTRDLGSGSSWILVQPVVRDRDWVWEGNLTCLGAKWVDILPSQLHVRRIEV